MEMYTKKQLKLIADWATTIHQEKLEALWNCGSQYKKLVIILILKDWSHLCDSKTKGY
jgi:hypothetical protein